MTPPAEPRLAVGAPRLAVIGDVHAHFSRLERVLARVREVGVDGVLLVGDLACAGMGPRTARTLGRYRGQVRDVLAAVAELGAPSCYVPGNHDLQGLDYPTNADGRAVEIAGLRVVGIGGSNPPPRGFPYEWDDAYIRGLKLPDGDILLSHCPPADALDFANGAQRHVGSPAIRERAARWRGALACGHIHEAAGVAQIHDCLCLNAGGLGHPFGRTQVGFLLGLRAVRHEDLDSGVATTLVRDGEPIRGEIG